MSPYALTDVPVDWEGYVMPLLDGARDLGDDITGYVRSRWSSALEPYAEVRTRRQEAVEQQFTERGLAYDMERFDHRIVGPAANIIATLPGGSAGTVYLTAHSDYIAGTGAEDNGSGIAVALAALDRLRDRDLPFTLKLAVFDCEEVDAGGSRYHVDQLSATEREDILAVINVDCVGAGPDLVIPQATYNITQRRGRTEVGPTIHGYLVEAARELGEEPVTARFDSFYSDHDPFCNAGIAAATVGSATMLDDDPEDPGFASPVHSPSDTIDALRGEYLDRALDVVLGAVERIIERAE